MYKDMKVPSTEQKNVWSILLLSAVNLILFVMTRLLEYQMTQRLHYRILMITSVATVDSLCLL